MIQVNCSHPVRLVATAPQRRLDLIETRSVEEVTELLELAQQLLLRPDALKKFREMNQEYMICGKRYV